MKFEKAFELVIGHEGGFTDDPDDRGNWTGGRVGEGELKGTKYGISAMSYPHLDIKNLTAEKAMEIYKKDFWDAGRIDEMPSVMRFQFFDAMINHGLRNASKIAQRAVNASDDGYIGPKTLEKMKRAESAEMLANFAAYRILFYTDIKTFSKYKKGWVKRAVNNLKIGLTEE